MGTGWWVADTLHGAGAFALVSWIFWVIFAITLHELGHGVAALRAGDDTPVRTGHMTLNPVVHMGVTSLIVFAVVGIAWGAMPVSPWKFRGRHADAVVAFAGPAVNIGLWIICVVATAMVVVWAPDTPTFANVERFFWTGAWLNAVLCVLNLLPIPPLDGSRIVASFIPSYRGLIEGPNAAVISLVGILFIFFVAGDFLFGGAGTISSWAVALAAGVLPG